MIHDNGSVQMRTIDVEATPLHVNGHIKNIYKRTLSRQEFIDGINKIVMVVEQVLALALASH